MDFGMSEIRVWLEFCIAGALAVLPEAVELHSPDGRWSGGQRAGC